MALIWTTYLLAVTHTPQGKGLAAPFLEEVAGMDLTGDRDDAAKAGLVESFVAMMGDDHGSSPSLIGCVCVEENIMVRADGLCSSIHHVCIHRET